MIEFHEGEKVIAEVRRHWLPLLGEGAALLLIGALPFAAEGLLASVGGRTADVLNHYGAHILVLESTWILLVWMVFAVIWTNHYLDVLIITDRRILDIEQVRLFERDIAELRVNNIEDMHVEVPGFLAHWLDFGNLELQTAAESKAFIVRNIEHPERVRAVISSMRENYHARAEGDLQRPAGTPADAARGNG